MELKRLNIDLFLIITSDIYILSISHHNKDLDSAMMTGSSDNIKPNAEDFHVAIGEETLLRAQAPRLLTITQADFEERVAEAIRDRAQKSTRTSTSNKQNIAAPTRSRRGSNS